MLKVALTGAIGAGKSTVARLLAERGAYVVDADAIAREVVAPGTPGLAAVVAEFGPDVLAADGTLDRRALAARVFDDERARARLEAIVHPRVAARSAALIAAAPPDAVVVYDVPLLVETGRAGEFDLVVVVDVPPDVQLDRLVRLRGLDEQDARRRIAAQASRQARLAMADLVLDNSGEQGALTAQVDRLWARLAGERMSRAAPGGQADAPAMEDGE